MVTIQTNIERLNRLILSLWRKNWRGIQRDEEEPLPAFFKTPSSEVKLLFIGINPALNKDDYRKILKKELKENPNLQKVYEEGFRSFITRSRTKVYNLHELISELELVEHIIGKHHNYEKRPKEIARYLGIDPGRELYMTDLFFIRKTNQAEFLKTYVYRNGKNINEGLTTFALRQLKILSILIKIINPKMIIICNAEAARLFKKYVIPMVSPKINYFCNEFGTYIININGRNVPIFYSSMLSGQRALDSFSFERLKWHMKTVMNKIIE
ncbi:hypothetical protein DER53_03500 [Parageobacillus toebii NBRC 107807]|uniref:Uncharacterized protein n=1 Tax=Parageobacillus toebii NBRC 107807 TaxID=1223503 RepID=A0A6G9J1Q3_9BACL|nr:hypothetical protein [Parageobacillus toebii]MBB3868688.1 hypothetical protein [Parageobacillus toebii NBRC 107807]QIQ32034.1 hypothetical protein DER53_03500 [Parageobacillus toebii NBRC 107807]